MEKRVLHKPDGRRLILYSRRPIPESLEAPSPSRTPPAKNSHLRYNPMRGEWAVYAGHRQNRTFLPPAEYDPLAPTIDPAQPTEVPAGDYDVAVFENMFPSLGNPEDSAPATLVPTKPAGGVCEVIVYTQDANTSLGALPLDRIELIFEVWADRYVELGKRPDVDYVFPFENRGVEVGATLHHPHGQIYAYPFIPPIPALELRQQLEFQRRDGRGLLADHLKAELADAQRILYAGTHAIAFVPIFARYAYEVWVAPIRAAPSLADLTSAERADLARALKIVLMKYDKLWGKPFPYVMVWHQAPTDGKPHPEAHAHAEFYPPYRMPGRLKYLAGSELGAGVF
ncbi:MAG: galactose-1-phosphate uridylyltransferase, partial [Verrucomicrobiae bacterium]|nr:galactose-1-phosphate uridylyltransferase [Verrucomicrobiae bacterium]